MNRKFLLSLLLVVLLVQTAAAAFTLTVNKPTAGATYNNTPLNRQTIDLNLTVVDNNTGVRDINIGIIYYRDDVLESSGVTIVNRNDWNAFASTNADMNCFGTQWASPGKTCRYKWTMPLDSEMPQGKYYIDFNVIAYNIKGSGYPGNVLYDANATVSIQINNKLPNIETIRSLLQTLLAVLAAAAIIAVVGIGVVVKPAPTELAKYGFMVGLTALFIALVIGVIITQL